MKKRSAPSNVVTSKANDVLPPLELEQDVLYHLETGLTHILVCAPANWDAQKVQSETNAKGTPGTSANEWIIAESSAETTNPCSCDQELHRKHWLLVC